MSTSKQPRTFHIYNISAEITDLKVTEAYLTFSVQGSSAEKQKAHTVAGTHGAFSWGDSGLDLEIADPTHASIEVKAFSRRPVIPDRLLGEFALTLAHPGATANLSGELTKKGSSNGRVSFKIRPKGSMTASRHGEVVTNRHSAYPSAQTLQKLPSKGTALHEAGAADQARGGAFAGDDAATVRSSAEAAEADERSNQVAPQAEGMTNATVNSTEQKLQQFKRDIEDGSLRPHQFDPEPLTQQSGAPAGMNTGQGAFSRTVGLPPEAGTAADESGAGAAHNVPYDVGTGGASGAVGGPVAPTGQGGVLAGTGANFTGPEKSGTVGQQLGGAAANAADKAQGALQSAKQSFSP